MTTLEVVDRRNPLPLYAQVEQSLKERLQAGVWKPGDQIPTEAELCEASGASRTVIRQALDDLVQAGLLVRVRGKGTFVAREKVSETWVQRLTGFHEDMVARGLTPVTVVLDQRIVPASDRLAELLGLRPGTLTLRLERLRSVTDSSPIVHVVSEIPAALCEGIDSVDFTQQSLYGYVEEIHGLRIASGRRTVEATPASVPQTDLLKVKPGAPLLRIESIAYLSDGRPFEHFVAYHRGDRTRLDVEVVRTRGGEGRRPADATITTLTAPEIG